LLPGSDRHFLLEACDGLFEDTVGLIEARIGALEACIGFLKAFDGRLEDFVDLCAMLQSPSERFELKFELGGPVTRTRTRGLNHDSTMTTQKYTYGGHI
jgi:hypothetical protein